LPESATARLGAGAHARELTGVVRHFGALVALSGIDLTVAAGERRAVLGSNGAGKTTLLDVVTGEAAPTAGRIRFFGEDVTGLPVHERIRRGLRRTYQVSQLFGGLSVRDSVYLACRGVTRRRFALLRPAPSDVSLAQADAILQAVRLDGARDAGVATLSHGQRRQLEIALALAGAPRFILFDEPAAGLSPAERRDLVAVLDALPRHVGYVIIEHDLEVALRVSDRVTVMHEGRIFREGTPAELEADPAVQEIYLGGRHG
jgi:branched-chain amino acid transport system ATP-binding protein